MEKELVELSIYNQDFFSQKEIAGGRTITSLKIILVYFYKLKKQYQWPGISINKLFIDSLLNMNPVRAEISNGGDK